MSKTIKDRVLKLGTSITKGLTHLDQPKPKTVIHAPDAITRADIEKAIAEASKADLARELVQAGKITPNDAREALGYPPVGLNSRPTAADLTLLWSEIDDLKARVRSVETIASSGEAVAHEAYGDAKDCLKANKRIDAAIQALSTAIQAHPTAPEVK